MEKISRATAYEIVAETTANEPCRICGKIIEDGQKSIYAGYSFGGKSRRAHIECWEENKDKLSWAYPVDADNPKRRIGIMKISADLVEEYGGIAFALAAIGFVPIRVEMLWHKREFEYIGYSRLFEEIEQGEAAPNYVINVDYSGYEPVVSVSRR